MLPASGLAAASTDEQDVSKLGNTRRRRILAIDGGGLKGVMPAAFLAQIEETTAQRIVNHFDLVVGTSTGGIIALGIGLGIPCKEILEFYRQHGPRVFGKPRCRSPVATFASSAWRQARRLVTNKHKPEPLLIALEEVFGERRLGESSTRLVVPAWDSERRHPCLFKTAHHPRFEIDYTRRVVDIAMATAAAPTYLPAHRMHGIDFVDGGVWANNPATVAAIEAVAVLGWEPQDIAMLSLGCTDEALVVPRKMGMVSGARVGVDMLLQGQALSALEAARILLGQSCGEQDRVCRVDETVQRGFAKLDDAARMEKLEGLGRAQAREWLPRIRKQFLMVPREQFVACHELVAVVARAPPGGRCSPQRDAGDTV